MNSEIKYRADVSRCAECNQIVKADRVPASLVVQLLVNVLVGVVLFKANNYLLPDRAFSDPISLLYSFSLILPSVALFFALFAVQYMGLVRVWLFMALPLIAVGAAMWGAVEWVDFARRFSL